MSWTKRRQTILLSRILAFGLNFVLDHDRGRRAGLQGHLQRQGPDRMASSRHGPDRQDRRRPRPVRGPRRGARDHGLHGQASPDVRDRDCRLYDGDFTLRLEFRASTNANSGLHLRDKAFGHQLQIRDYPRVGPYKSLQRFKDRDWNKIEVVVVGKKPAVPATASSLRPRARDPRKRTARARIRNQRRRISEHSDQEAELRVEATSAHGVCATCSREGQIRELSC